jgi:uncharacterized membrane protein
MNTSNARLASVDVARGAAVAMMFVYHFCFDLANFGFIHQNLYDDRRWIAWRALILGSFLLLAGASLALAWRQARPWRGYWRRLLLIAGCAALVSLGSWLLFPDSWIWFGVLHHLALASLLAVPFISRPRLALGTGLALLLLGTVWQFPRFDSQPWQFVGLMSFKPRTEDYVPLLPWFGVVLCGICLGHLLAGASRLQRFRAQQFRVQPAQWLAWSGRHSLPLYMIHQPVFIGLLLAIRWLSAATHR